MTEGEEGEAGWGEKKEGDATGGGEERGGPRMEESDGGCRKDGATVTASPPITDGGFLSSFLIYEIAA